MSNNTSENPFASITYGLNPDNFESSTTTRKAKVNNKNKKTKKNESKSENKEPSNRYPHNILDRMYPHTLYYFNRQISFNLPLEDINIIVGPEKFRILQFNGKNFFIFGEDHRFEYKLQQLYNSVKILNLNLIGLNLIGFDGFVRSLISRYAEFNFELYYEKQASWNKREENNHKNNEHIKTRNISSMISILDELFLNCSRMFNKSDCEYSNLRVHHADARLYGFSGKVLDLFWKTMSHDEIKQWDTNFTNYIKTSKQFSTLIEKQKQGISIDIIKTLDDYFYEIFLTDSTSQQQLQNKFEGFLDYYTILRMLRDFDETKTTGGRTKHWPQKNIIGYFGYHHLETLNQILLQLGAQEVYTFDNQHNHPLVQITKECIDKIDELIQQS
jgi:hypothetical protein